MTDHPIMGPGEAGIFTRPPIFHLNAQSVSVPTTTGTESVIVLIQPDTVWANADTDNPVDVVAQVMTHSGAQPVTVPHLQAGLPGATSTAMTGVLTPGADLFATTLRLAFTDGPKEVAYDGTMPITARWLADLRTDSVAVITGPIKTINDIEPIIRAGKALWLRIPLAVRR